jgi:hypothetical protein
VVRDREDCAAWHHAKTAPLPTLYRTKRVTVRFIMTTACFWSPPETCMEDRFCGEHTNFTTSVWCSTCTVSTAACAREDTSYICHVDLERIIYTGTQRTDDHPHVLISTIKYCCVCFVCVSVCLGISVCRLSCAFVAQALTQAIR